MTLPNSDPESDLLNYYQSEVPPDFRKALLPRLDAQLSARRPNRWRLFAASGVAAAVALAVWLALPSHERPEANHPLIYRPPSATEPSLDPTIASARKLPDTNTVAIGSPGALSLAFMDPSMESQVSMASVIVRARVVSGKDTLVAYAVERVVYGTLSDKTITLDPGLGNQDMKRSFLDFAHTQFLAEQHREPSPEELRDFMLKLHGIENGHEVLLLLNPRDGGFQATSIYSDPGPDYPRDKEVVQIIHDGGYLENIASPGLEDYFHTKLHAADAIVRATVVEVTDTATRWRVDKVLKGTAISEPLEISHNVFRRRAEAWISFNALNDDTLKDPVKRQTQIDQEVAAMIKAELASGRQAILFLGKPESQAGITHAELQHRLYETSHRMSLEQLEDLIPKPNILEKPAIQEIKL